MTMIKENEEEHNFNKILKCVKCENYLEETIINENEVLFLCSNKYCAYPLDSENLCKYIMNKSDLNYQILDKLRNIQSQNNDIIRHTSFNSEYQNFDNDFR